MVKLHITKAKCKAQLSHRSGSWNQYSLIHRQKDFRECSQNSLSIKHSGPCNKILTEWAEKSSLALKKDFIAGLVSICAAQIWVLKHCRSFSWPSPARSTTVVNLTLPIYSPFMSHYHVTLSARKSFSGFTRFISCVLLQYLAQIKYLPTCMPAQSPSLSYLLFRPHYLICKERCIY